MPRTPNPTLSRHASGDASATVLARLVLALLSTLFLGTALQASAGLSQQGTKPADRAPEAQPPAPSLIESVEVRYVLVPITVRDREGLVSDLERDDFRLTVDGRSVAIESFDRGEDLPSSLVVLQDLSGSMAMGSKLARARRVVECLLERRRPGDRLALATFADRSVAVEVPFTEDPEPVREAMSRWDAYGLTALYDALARLPGIDPRGEMPGKAVVLLTDGVENASRLDPDRARKFLRRAELPVYAFDLAAPPAGGGSRSPAGRPLSLLRRLAEATGGRYLPAAGDEQIDAACVEAVTELRARFVLGFTSGAGESRWRRLRVEIARDGLTHAARSGYLGGPAETGGGR